MARWRASLAGLLILVVTAVFTAPTVRAAVVPGRPGAAGAPQPSRTLTLLTGDQVVLTQSSPESFTFVPARGRPAHGYISRTLNGRGLVVPSDVAPLVPDVLDPALFDVTRLLEEQGDDSADADINIIASPGLAVTGGTPLNRRASAERSLPSIGAVAQQLPKERAADVGAALVAGLAGSTGITGGRTEAAAPAATPKRVWLDRRVKASWDRNLEQVGAPAAWSAGWDGTGTTIAVLDTGVDATHPDLAGKVVAQENFGEWPDALDHFGHGTHVASIAAGSGAAGNGQRQGVAPGAKVLSGKVLGDDGVGWDSTVIAGVEWAAAQRVDVANLSIESEGQSDGSDPLSLAIDAMTEQSGTLFVVAAGNYGAPNTIGSPGSATQALTVGAVDADDKLAPFSSRGPRLGGGVKPEITAPGVDIVAAWSSLSGGSPDNWYLPMSGTSMATPHVAGAAAALAHAHPQWTAAQLKAALVSTAQEQPGQSVHEQGGGRLSLPAALAARVLPATPTLDLGLQAYPQTATPFSVDVAWTNVTDQDFTVDLTDTGELADIPGAVSIDPARLRLAPGATGTTRLVLRPGEPQQQPAAGVHGGEVVASLPSSGPGSSEPGSGLPFVFEKEPERYNLSLRLLDTTGRPASLAFLSVFDAADMTRFADPAVPIDEQGRATVRAAPGRYHLDAVMTSYDESGGQSSAWVVKPEVLLRRATTVTLDARTARQLHVDVADRATAPIYQQWHERRTDAAGHVATFAVGAFGPVSLLAAAPTRPVRVGALDTYANVRVGASQLTFEGIDGMALPLLGSAAFLGDRRLRVVDVGAGTKAEFAKRDVRGAIAVASRARDNTPSKIAANASAAKAALAVLVNSTDEEWQAYLEAEAATPTVTVTATTGSALLAAQSVRVRGTMVPDPVYDLAYVSRGRFPAATRHTVTSTDVRRMARIRTTMADVQPSTIWAYTTVSRAPVIAGFDLVGAFGESMPPGTRRMEYVQPGAWLARAERMGEVEPAALSGQVRTENARTSRTETWFGAPWRPTTRQDSVMGDAPGFYRDKATIYLGNTPLVDADGHAETMLSYGPVISAYTVRRNGSVVATASGRYVMVPFAAGPARLTIEHEVDARAVLPTQNRSRTVWSTHSTSPRKSGVSEPVPLLEVDLRLCVSLEAVLTGRKATVEISRPFGDPVSLKLLTVEVSTDAGRTWLPAKLKMTSERSANVAVPSLPADGSGDLLSVRVTAHSRDGDKVTQTLYAAALLP